jgi:HSP20 family protein
MARFEEDELWKLSARIEKVFEELVHGQQPMMMMGEQGWAPDVDVYETEDKLIVLAEIAGVSVDNVSIVVHGNLLRISGYRGYPRGERKQRLHQMEISFGRFERIIRLPMRVVDEEIKASYRDGFLTITIPKSKAQGFRRIEIEAE